MGVNNTFQINVQPSPINPLTHYRHWGRGYALLPDMKAMEEPVPDNRGDGTQNEETLRLRVRLAALEEENDILAKAAVREQELVAKVQRSEPLRGTRERMRSVLTLNSKILLQRHALRVRV